MRDAEQRAAAKKFAADWKDKGCEKGQSQLFWMELLEKVYGVESPAHFISFENQAHLDNHGFINGLIPTTHVLIEQKGLGNDLRKPVKQSDGTLLTPFQQAKRYAATLPYSQRPRWIVTCNFSEFNIYDMKHPAGEPEIVFLKDLGTQYYRLNFLTESGDENIKKEMEVSIQAGNLVGVLYDAILKQYKDPTNLRSVQSLNMLCVRLAFCLYAEDSGLFGARPRFHDYIKSFAVKDVRRALIDLFRALDTLPEERDPYLDESLAVFPYVNGGLFAEEDIEIPNFTQEIVDLLLHNGGENFNWSEVSPTIFGAVFESTLNTETRRSGGMHYTSLENIHKLIAPLFLDELRDELAGIKDIKVAKTRKTKVNAFRDKLAGLTFLDPACGSGNFLTETYISLRRLENEAIDIIMRGQMLLDFGNVIRVSIGQFYGIEINDFAVTVAKTALWIAENQMMKETELIVNRSLDFLPLKSYANIVEGNALRLDWESVVPKDKLSYIMGNPPFVGARLMGKEQKDDLLSVFGSKWRNAGNLDYVSCWYKKAADMMGGTDIRTALVSTNSVSQGESVAILWKPLFESGVHIDFAHRTFRWDSEASIKAHVHCVIIGFSIAPNRKPKFIYSEDRLQVAQNINGYLLDAENVFVESRSKPICDVPEVGMGNQPIDSGNYLFTREERDAFLEKEPAAEKWFVPWYGAQEFINRNPRYCLWIGNCPPHELQKMPECMKRVEGVREARLASKRVSTLKLADTPTRFQTENMPTGSYIVIPEVSSEKREYIPMGYMSASELCSNKLRLMPKATLFHLGVLTSNVHMAWVRIVCGRLEMRYDYSIKIVYNNFPWPNATDEQKTKIEQNAQAILDARALYPDCSLADLYGELTMPLELRKAHQANDRAVMQAYGFDVKTMTESSCVAELMKMYQKMTEVNPSHIIRTIEY
ncbi:MAG: methylase [Clostridia bacterium]|nr:methylase [Clostridia bacterium]